MTGIQFNKSWGIRGFLEGIYRGPQKKEEVLAAAQEEAGAGKKRRRSVLSTSASQPERPKVYARVSRRSFGNGSMNLTGPWPPLPEGQRLGLLTHPSWLVSHSDAMDNHAILRGRWIRERLLGRRDSRRSYHRRCDASR